MAYCCLTFSFSNIVLFCIQYFNRRQPGLSNGSVEFFLILQNVEGFTGWTGTPVEDTPDLKKIALANGGHW